MKYFKVIYLFIVFVFFALTNCSKEEDRMKLVSKGVEEVTDISESGDLDLELTACGVEAVEKIGLHSYKINTSVYGWSSFIFEESQTSAGAPIFNVFGGTTDSVFVFSFDTSGNSSVTKFKTKTDWEHSIGGVTLPISDVNSYSNKTFLKFPNNEIFLLYIISLVSANNYSFNPTQGQSPNNPGGRIAKIKPPGLPSYDDVERELMKAAENDCKPDKVVRVRLVVFPFRSRFMGSLTYGCDNGTAITY